MESFALYLLKSAVWLTGFSLVYLLFLRNERFFRIKRAFLIAGILASFLLPLISIHYIEELPASQIIPPVGITDTNSVSVPAGETIVNGTIFSYKHVLLLIYFLGIIILTIRIIKQIIVLYRTIRNNNFSSRGRTRIIRIQGIKSPFSFFNYVFISSSAEPGDAEQILNHEEVHIRQKHWLDLLLAELIRLLQWVNPFAWIYSGFVRQNHEYLADEAALQLTSDPPSYKAALLNQIFNVPVIPLSNTFYYSTGKKRFEMMKKVISSPYRKLRILFVLPVAALIFYAFATPEYQNAVPAKTQVKMQPQQPAVTADNKKVSGTVSTSDGKPLEGATILVRGTTNGTITDNKGSFTIANVSADGQLNVSYIGFRSKTVTPDFVSVMTIKLQRDTVSLSSINVPPPPPPPPADKGVGNRSENGDKPLLVVDGEIRDNIDDLSPDMIKSINVLKGSLAVEKYGEKAKNGVLEIITKSNSEKITEQAPPPSAYNKNTMVMVEEMPMFEGGEDAMKNWIYGNIRLPGSVDRSKIKDPLNVVFIVSSSGKIANVRVIKPVHPLLDAEAIRVVSAMPDWLPGKQNGKSVDVVYQLPIDFNPGKIKITR